MSSNQLLGNKGEQWAAEYLAGKGFTVLERNYRYKKAEIDIIARKDKLLIFVEVKTRSSTEFGEPEEAVSKSKTALVQLAAEQYMEQTGWLHDIRFDIIAIHVQNPPQIFHIEDAF